MLSRAYRYFFFRCLFLFGREKGRQHRAVAFLSVLAGLNILSAVLLAERVAGRVLVPLFEPAEVYALVMFVTLCVLHYGGLARDDRYLTIIEEFPVGEPSRALEVAFALYVVGSLGLFFGLIGHAG
jgi:hypothetical protein